MRPLLLAAVMLACAACSTVAVAATPVAEVDSAAPPAVVELDVFSGRPNPTWTLSEADRDDLCARLAALPAAAPTGLESNLGYRGFVVRMPTTPAAATVTVQEGTVHVSGDGADHYYRDPDRELERWLLETGDDALEPQVADLVEQELAA